MSSSHCKAYVYWRHHFPDMTIGESVSRWRAMPEETKQQLNLMVASCFSPYEWSEEKMLEHFETIDFYELVNHF